MKPTVKNIKESSFRVMLLEHCQESFKQFFNNDIQKEYDACQTRNPDLEEKYLKFKHRLLGSKNQNVISFYEFRYKVCGGAEQEKFVIRWYPLVSFPGAS